MTGREPDPLDPHDLLDMTDLAAHFGITEHTLRVRRYRRQAPPMFWARGRLYITRAQLDAWTALYGTTIQSINRRIVLEEGAASK